MSQQKPGPSSRLFLLKERCGVRSYCPEISAIHRSCKVRLGVLAIQGHNNGCQQSEAAANTRAPCAANHRELRGANRWNFWQVKRESTCGESECLLHPSPPPTSSPPRHFCAPRQPSAALRPHLAPAAQLQRLPCRHGSTFTATVRRPAAHVLSARADEGWDPSAPSDKLELDQQDVMWHMPGVT